MKRIVLLGCPGAGKGTQAEFISKRFNLPAISTGAMLRAAIQEQSALGLQAKDYVNRGELVPDSLILDLIDKRLAEKESSQSETTLFPIAIRSRQSPCPSHTA